MLGIKGHIRPLHTVCNRFGAAQKEIPRSQHPDNHFLLAQKIIRQLCQLFPHRGCPTAVFSNDMHRPSAGGHEVLRESCGEGGISESEAGIIVNVHKRIPQQHDG